MARRITTIRADAIVNAANSAMLDASSRCTPASTRPPAPDYAECADIMAARVVLSPLARRGRRLPPPAAHVIHNVGPIVQGKPTAEHEALLASYRSCLLAAEDLRATSIALCCISTGIFGWPQGRGRRRRGPGT